MSSVIEQPTGIIVKSDRTGRTRYTTQYKQEVVAAFESSSLSAPDFARQCGIKYPTFAAWVSGNRKLPGSANGLRCGNFKHTNGTMPSVCELHFYKPVVCAAPPKKNL